MSSGSEDFITGTGSAYPPAGQPDSDPTAWTPGGTGLPPTLRWNGPGPLPGLPDPTEWTPAGPALWQDTVDSPVSQPVSGPTWIPPAEQFTSEPPWAGTDSPPPHDRTPPQYGEIPPLAHRGIQSYGDTPPTHRTARRITAAIATLLLIAATLTAIALSQADDTPTSTPTITPSDQPI
ncbi:hypothetical protein [Nocardia lasii]|uniref:Uncharacterized protein n=1 Tax=Nocardia lasii TaxID=1616107 RepID=A0ABW1JLA4_9NOCA